LKDPVCGMTVTTHSFHHLEQAGQVHYFCSVSCKKRFADHAVRYTHSGLMQHTAPRSGLHLPLNLNMFSGHARWILLISAAAVLATLGVWLV
jgi:YHS domain-containing protein